MLPLILGLSYWRQERRPGVQVGGRCLKSRMRELGKAAEIRSLYLTSKSLERYRFAILFDYESATMRNESVRQTR